MSGAGDSGRELPFPQGAYWQRWERYRVAADLTFSGGDPARVDALVNLADAELAALRAGIQALADELDGMAASADATSAHVDARAVRRATFGYAAVRARALLSTPEAEEGTKP